jgi:hypothetical protein
MFVPSVRVTVTARGWVEPLSAAEAGGAAAITATATTSVVTLAVARRSRRGGVVGVVFMVLPRVKWSLV